MRLGRGARGDCRIWAVCRAGNGTNSGYVRYLNGSAGWYSHIGIPQASRRTDGVLWYRPSDFALFGTAEA